MDNILFQTNVLRVPIIVRKNPFIFNITQYKQVLCIFWIELKLNTVYKIYTPFAITFHRYSILNQEIFNVYLMKINFIDFYSTKTN